MKNARFWLLTAATVLMSTPAFANTTVSTGTPLHRWSYDTITVNLERDGTVTRGEWMGYQSRKYDNVSLLNAEPSSIISKRKWMELQSERFNEIDTAHDNRISQDQFVAQKDWLRDWYVNGISTSRPQALNQYTPTSHIPGGADTAVGWTGQ